VGVHSLRWVQREQSPWGAGRGKHGDTQRLKLDALSYLYMPSDFCTRHTREEPRGRHAGPVAVPRVPSLPGLDFLERFQEGVAPPCRERSVLFLETPCLPLCVRGLPQEAITGGSLEPLGEKGLLLIEQPPQINKPLHLESTQLIGRSRLLSFSRSVAITWYPVVEGRLMFRGSAWGVCSRERHEHRKNEHVLDWAAPLPAPLLELDLHRSVLFVALLGRRLGPLYDGVGLLARGRSNRGLRRVEGARVCHTLASEHR